MSHDDAAIYERAIKLGIEKMNYQEEINDERIICDYCDISHRSDYECDYSILFNMILDLSRKVDDNWEMDYKSIDNISKRVSTLELKKGSLSAGLNILQEQIHKCVDAQMIYTMRQTIEAWQKGCEALIGDLQLRVKDIEYRLGHIIELPSEIDIRLQDVERKIDGMPENYTRRDKELAKLIDECIGEISQLKKTKAQADLVADHYIKTENRLEKLEKRIEDIAEFCDRNWKHNKEPHKCPICNGKYIAMFKECESSCLACDKGIVWG